jgi:hypothetical protein
MLKLSNPSHYPPYLPKKTDIYPQIAPIFLYMPLRKIAMGVCALLFVLIADRTFAQPIWTFDLFDEKKKPEKFKEKKLVSEKSADKKFTQIRRFTANNITHYNYYYNANTKLNGILDRARASHKDDYSQLLSFYPFSLDNTASQSGDLDSVIYKSIAGILLHDLRSDWVDNMYLLIGKSYYYRKDFPRKKNEDDTKIVGGNGNGTMGKISIANLEKRNFLQKVMSLPPSRNDALLWFARTLIAQDELGEAASLINILKEDPNLPKRLQNDLSELNAWWFYKQSIYDSAAAYLEKGISNAEFKEDKSRWEFLVAQMCR